MKIKIKITRYTLICIINVYDAIELYHEVYPSEIHFTKEFKARKSIIDALIVKLKKKEIGMPKHSKDLILSMEYHQAYSLMSFLSVNITVIDGNLEQTLLRKLIDNIYQEL